tara:strand:+ start:79 stop:225 length:147 start_codon:yes stop_codon:yes gene_type:complete
MITLLKKVWRTNSNDVHIITTGQILDYMGMGLVVGAMSMALIILGMLP